MLELVANTLLLAPFQSNLVYEDHVVGLSDCQLIGLRRKCHLTDYIILWALFYINNILIFISQQSWRLLFTLSAGFVENLSFLTPFSSNMTTILSVVHIARRLPFGAQHTAVTFTQPGFGCVRDSIYFSCILPQLPVLFHNHLIN